MLTPAMAWAQCTGGLIVNCPDASALQSNDYLLGYQNNQSPHYRRVTPAEVLTGGFAAQFSSMNASGGGTLGGAWVLNGPAQALTVQNSGSFGGTLGIGGALSASGGGTLTGAFSLAGGALTITTAGIGLSVSNNAIIGGTVTGSGAASFPTIRARAPNFASGSTPPPLGPGDVIFETNCIFATEGSPNGCLAFSNNSGAFTQILSPTALTMSIAGLTGRLGGSVAGQGNGSSLLTATGAFVPGNAITTNSAGAAIDAGVPPGGGGSGGIGTVNNCTAADSSAYYASIGTAVGCLPQVNSSVLSRSSGGVLAESATLPSVLTAPNLNLTGTATAAALTMTSALTTAASVAGGSNFVITPGVAPTSPVNGAMWSTALGFLGHSATGGTVGPFIDLTKLSASGGVSYLNTTGAFTCPACVSTWTPPLAFATGTASVANFPWLAQWSVDTGVTVHNDTYFIPDRWRYTSGAISDIYFWTGAGTFTVTVQANGSIICTANVTTANTSLTPGTATCPGTLLRNQPVALVISSAAGSPISAGVGINGSFTP